MAKKNQSIEDLLDTAYESEDIEEVKRISKQILENDPNNKDALMLFADTLEDAGERLTLLERAHRIAKKDFDAIKFDEDDDPLDTDEGLVHAGILQRLIIPLVDVGRTPEAIEYARELRRIDAENINNSDSLYYFALLKSADYPKVLEETMSDGVRSLGREWAKFIALFKLSDNAPESIFWDAVKMSPEVPFYMFGKYDEPIDDNEADEEDFSLALLFSDVLMPDEFLGKWVIGRSALFGLLSGRIHEDEDDEHDIAIDILKKEGIFERYKILKKECEKFNSIDDSDELDILVIEKIVSKC